MSQAARTASASGAAATTTSLAPGAALAAFGVNLLARVTPPPPPGDAEQTNVFVSPFSVFQALAMVQVGATPPDADGVQSAVAAEFRTVLGLDLSDDATRTQFRTLGAELTTANGPVTVLVANSVWAKGVGDDGGAVKPAYVAALKRDFNALAARLPTSAAPINEWVSRSTEGKITNLVDDAVVADPLVRVLLINAVYFKGAWRRKFDIERTVEARFHSGGGPGGDGMPCMMMSMKAKMPVVRMDDGGVAVALAYGNATSDMRAVAYLPPIPTPGAGAGAEAGARAGERKFGAAAGTAAAAARAMTPAAWAELSARLSDGRQEQQVHLRLPRFKVEFGAADLTPSLRAMGLGAALDRSGGFLAMSDDPNLHLSAVIHKAMAEVNEEGTEAAAATAAVMVTRSMPAPPLLVSFDRPFLFFVEHAASGAILFAGVINQPGSGV